MSNLKVVVQLYDEKTGEYIGDADVRTTADLVFFADGQTFQQKLDNGTLRGQQGQKGDQGERGVPGQVGATGPIGPTGATGPKGEPGKDGSNFRVGASYDTATERKMFLRLT